MPFPWVDSERISMLLFQRDYDFSWRTRQQSLDTFASGMVLRCMPSGSLDGGN